MRERGEEKLSHSLVRPISSAQPTGGAVAEIAGQLRGWRVSSFAK